MLQTYTALFTLSPVCYSWMKPEAVTNRGSKPQSISSRADGSTHNEATLCWRYVFGLHHLRRAGVCKLTVVQL